MEIDGSRTDSEKEHEKSSDFSEFDTDIDIWSEGLGEGVQSGIASEYFGDQGISSNPYVLAAETFETASVEIPTEENRYSSLVAVSDNNPYSGSYCGVHQWEASEEGPTARFVIPENAHRGVRPAYFMRMCFQYDSSFHPGDLDRAVGVKGFGIYFEDGSGNASTCDGMSWYNVSCQFVGWGPSVKPEANDGFLWVGHLYSYNRYPQTAEPILGDVRISDAADGTESCRFSAYPDPFVYIKFDTWSCYELGLYLNTPGKADGEARFWIDGQLKVRTANLRFREREDQLPTSMQLNLHRTTPNFDHTMIRYVDNIVLATRYIGLPAAVSD